MSIDKLYKFLQWLEQVIEQKVKLAKIGFRVWEGYAVVSVFLTIILITFLVSPIIMPVLKTGDLEAIGPQQASKAPEINQTAVFYTNFGKNKPNEVKVEWDCEPTNQILFDTRSGYQCGVGSIWPENDSAADQHEVALKWLKKNDTDFKVEWTSLDTSRTKIRKFDVLDYEYPRSDDESERTGADPDKFASVVMFSTPRPAGRYLLKITVFPGQLNRTVQASDRSKAKIVEVEKANSKSFFELQKIDSAIGLFVLFTVWFSGLQTLVTLFDRISAKSES